MTAAEKRASVQADIAARVADAELEPDVDGTALILQGLRRRGSGINLRSTRSTTARMTRILKLLGLSPSQHGDWCGFPLKVWLAENPSWNEREWTTLVAENYQQIKESA